METKECNQCHQFFLIVEMSTRYRNTRCQACVRAARHPLERTHTSMKQRCFNPNVEAYKNYGGRGIKVHPSLMKFKDFVNYVETALDPKPAGYTLDRIDNDGDYAPGNLKWSSRQEQARNRRRRASSKVKYWGVCYDKKGRRKPYKAQITINGRAKHIDYFSFPEAAAIAYDKEAIKLMRETGLRYNLNFRAVWEKCGVL